MRLIHTIDLDHIKDTKRVIKCSKSKDIQYIGQQKIIKKQQTRVDKPIHRKLKIKQHEH
jgi:hypothetical protein